ncbi:MAG TPA: ABC transporter substrate-binding protein [Candidatus Competibacter sp.]|nr:toluene tolerance protein [Candidatus Competibacteraceae bacterium]HRE53622.1 ABC transporter substrate-binding protein [Candidatus Competibacter sp.]HUM93618.1 ABC transporter substrate-binding protein [Candidatus Competibacter sp.]
MKRLLTVGLLMLALGSGWTVAATPPENVVQQTSERMLDALRQNRATIDRDPGQIYALVNQIVLPNFDFELMSRWVLGRAWQQATPEQRRQFTEEFRALLVRTYAKALLEYADEAIKVSPAGAPAGAEATVRTEVQPKSGRPIQINYSMHLGNDAWKVYDVTVDGISLVTNYRDTFASQVRANGMDAVITDLRRRNAGSAR